MAVIIPEDFSGIGDPEGLRTYLDQLRNCHNAMSALERTVAASLKASILIMGEPDSKKIASSVTRPIVRAADYDDSAAKNLNLAWRRAVRDLLPKPAAATGLAGKPFKRT